MARVKQAAAPTASELLVPARRSELGMARKFAGDVATKFGLDADTRYEFVYAVNEAVTNAIKHGASDEEGMIHLRIVAQADRLTFAVHDRGTFTMPVLDSDATSQGGRGLALMASLVDEVELHIGPGGTTVRLHKTRPSENGHTWEAVG
jgi:anti-sigma regulatory factor (Ser/Thr protein kinase)